MVNLETIKDEDIFELGSLVSTHTFRLNAIPSVKITVTIWKDAVAHGRNFFQYDVSHAMHTSTQFGPYYPSVSFADSETGALQKALPDLLNFYHSGIAAGHEPNELWLVPRGR
jgi:hypothetical protein